MGTYLMGVNRVAVLQSDRVLWIDGSDSSIAM